MTTKPGDLSSTLNISKMSKKSALIPKQQSRILWSLVVLFFGVFLFLFFLIKGFRSLLNSPIINLCLVRFNS